MNNGTERYSVLFFIISIFLLFTTNLFGYEPYGKRWLNMKILDMNKVDKRVNLRIEARCDQVLTNPGSYICYDYKFKGPLFNIYTADNRVNKVNLKHRLKFRPDKRIPVEYRSDIRCFANNDYDLGHLKPDADADWSVKSLKYTYLMSNVVPQPSKINRYVISKWEDVERDMTKVGVIIVITGADYYNSQHLNNDHNCTSLPKDYYKIIFVKNSDGKYYPNMMFVAYKYGKVKFYSKERYIYNFLRRRGIKIL